MTVWHQAGGGPALVAIEAELVDGTWIELAGATLHAEGGLEVDMAGRQTELDRTDNATARLVLDNSSGDYTPGSDTAATPLFQGMRIRVRETIGRRSWYLIHGTLQQPEAVYGEHANDAKVVVSAVDVFGEHDTTGRTFVSTLGEYIRDAGGEYLVGYWPMGEASGSTQAETEVAGQTPLSVQRRTDYDGTHAAPNELIDFGGTAGPPADDISAVTFQPLRTPVLVVARDRLRTAELADVSFDDADAVAISLWYRMSPDLSTSDQAMVAIDNNFTNTFNMITVGTTWTATFQTDAGTLQIAGSAAKTETWQLLTMRLDTTTGAAAFWIDGQEYLGSLGGPSTGGLDTLAADGLWPGSAACHLQVYAGPTTHVNRQLHLAQYAHGTDEFTGGLRFQRTDERFRTLCRYAGLPEPDCDYGSSWMQRAELAGKSFAQAREEAVRTEQGRAFVAGNGTPQFHSRVRTRYNF